MTKGRWMTAVAGLGFALPAHAQDQRAEAGGTPQGVNSPLVLIYRVPRVLDNSGTNNVGVATVFVCTSNSTANETIRFVVRRSDSTVAKDINFVMDPRSTFTFSTHSTAPFGGVLLGT